METTHKTISENKNETIWDKATPAQRDQLQALHATLRAQGVEIVQLPVWDTTVTWISIKRYPTCVLLGEYTYSHLSTLVHDGVVGTEIKMLQHMVACLPS